MIAVQVSDKHAPELRGLDITAEKLMLGSLAAVE
jgi:hypothetical protein